ncbi:MAG: Holliday junction branch migration protein RuvA [Gammaproteobacteria bacterium]|nr:Holliday junction branch migration protein RuvA [Gammaproteobacteria bacterium]
MIGRLHGVLISKQAPTLLLDVNGVGYELEAPMTTFYNLPPLGETVTLHTHLVVREDAHLLFGFIQASDRTLFRSLIKINGVGAKLALTILSGMSVKELSRCVERDDPAPLVKLPGVGKKTAERLIIELRGKLKELAPAPTLPDAVAKMTASVLPADQPDPIEDAVSALVALGYKAQEASRMVRSIESQNKSSEEIIRMALQNAVAKV